jgi:acetyltransferase-like isoleucine patch superfamily enzyme
MVYKFIWFLNTFLLRFFIKHIGLLSYIGKTTYVSGGRNIIIGTKVRIFPGLRAECHNGGEIIIKDDVSIGQNLHIISSNTKLTIGAHTTLSGNVFITNIDHSYNIIEKHILQQDYVVRQTEIGEFCFMGYGVVIQAGTILGNQCIVGANSVVRGIFPDYCVIVGAPAKIVKRYNFETKNWDKTDAQGNFEVV